MWENITNQHCFNTTFKIINAVQFGKLSKNSHKEQIPCYFIHFSNGVTAAHSISIVPLGAKSSDIKNYTWYWTFRVPTHLLQRPTCLALGGHLTRAPGWLSSVHDIYFTLFIKDKCPPQERCCPSAVFLGKTTWNTCNHFSPESYNMCFHSGQPRENLPLTKRDAKKCTLQKQTLGVSPNHLLSPLISGELTASTAQSHGVSVAHTHTSWPGHGLCALCTHSPHWPLCGLVSDGQCGKRKFCCFTNKYIPTLAGLWINTTNDYSVACPQNNDDLEGMLPEMDLLEVWRGGIETKWISWEPERKLSESHLSWLAGRVCLMEDPPGCYHYHIAVRGRDRNARNQTHSSLIVKCRHLKLRK